MFFSTRLLGQRVDFDSVFVATNRIVEDEVPGGCLLDEDALAAPERAGGVRLVNDTNKARALHVLVALVVVLHQVVPRRGPRCVRVKIQGVAHAVLDDVVVDDVR